MGGTAFQKRFAVSLQPVDACVRDAPGLIWSRAIALHEERV